MPKCDASVAESLAPCCLSNCKIACLLPPRFAAPVLIRANLQPTSPDYQPDSPYFLKQFLLKLLDSWQRST